jgi:hypothetical protein
MYIAASAATPDVAGLGFLGGEVDQAIKAAERQMQVHADRERKYSASGAAGAGTAARREIAQYWEWSRERDFLQGLKAAYESQAGVRLSYRSYPVTKADPATGRSSKDTPWRPSATRQVFQQLEADGSFCLGASRGMAFRTLFGLDRPSNRAVLTDLNRRIEAAKKAGDTSMEAKLLISRIVSHSHDPGSLKQFNQDVAARYAVKNTEVRSATRSEAVAALKQGAPVLADLDGGWHWVLVQQSPRGRLWASDPLSGSGVRAISASELGSRYELIVDAATGKVIAPGQAAAHRQP